MKYLSLFWFLFLSGLSASQAADSFESFTDSSGEISIECAKAMAVSIHDAEERFSKNYLSESFSGLACNRGNFIEINFIKINKRIRGGGLYYKIDRDGMRIIDYKATR